MSDRLASMARETGTRIVLTYRDYEALPADGRRYELHEGDLAVTPAPGTLHQRAVGMLYRLLSQYAEAHRLGDVFVSPVDCILSNATVVQPDIVYVESSRSSLVSPRGIEGPPTLVIEVLSPSSALIDQGIKRQLYARYGIPYYWIVAPDGPSIEGYTLAEGAFRLAACLAREEGGCLPPFPDFTVVPASLVP